jgi:hypothetical protein
MRHCAAATCLDASPEAGAGRPLITHTHAHTSVPVQRYVFHARRMRATYYCSVSSHGAKARRCTVDVVLSSCWCVMGLVGHSHRVWRLRYRYLVCSASDNVGSTVRTPLATAAWDFLEKRGSIPWTWYNHITVCAAWEHQVVRILRYRYLVRSQQGLSGYFVLLV